jgi:Rrf2 family protein
VPVRGLVPALACRTVRITAKVDYAVRAMCELATHVGGPVRGERIATAQAIPQSFLENILHELKRAGLVSTQRGVDGGYRLAKPADQISVADIIRAVEGPLADVRGTRPEQLAYEGAAEHLRAVWLAVRVSLRSVLEQVTVADIASGHLPAAIPELLEDPEALRPH